MREQRLAAMQAKMTNKSKIDDRSAQEIKDNPYKSSMGVNERANEKRARALLNKNDKISESIHEKELQEKQKKAMEAELIELEKLKR